MGRTARSVTGLVVGLVVLVGTALPAAGNTVDLGVTGGSQTLRFAGGGTIDTIDLASTVDCATVTSTATTTLGTSISVTLRFAMAVEVNGQHFVAQLTLTMSGTYSGTAPTYTVSAPRRSRGRSSGAPVRGPARRCPVRGPAP